MYTLLKSDAFNGLSLSDKIKHTVPRGQLLHIYLFEISYQYHADGCA